MVGAVAAQPAASEAVSVAESRGASEAAVEMAHNPEDGHEALPEVAASSFLAPLAMAAAVLAAVSEAAAVVVVASNTPPAALLMAALPVL